MDLLEVHLLNGRLSLLVDGFLGNTRVRSNLRLGSDSLTCKSEDRAVGRQRAERGVV